MTTIRLLADDLTGALDTAAELTRLADPIPVFWTGAIPPALPATCALDSGTREADGETATRRVGELAGLLSGAALPYKKVDSLLRGHALAELASCWNTGAWDRCVLAPAFPFQGRITTGGVQRVHEPDGSLRAVADLVRVLADQGIAACRHLPGEPLGLGITVCDAESEGDLAQAAALGRAASGRVLWCGSAGLAQALAGGSKRADKPPDLSGRVLGLFGSDQEITSGQLRACGEQWLRLSGPETAPDVIAERLELDGVVLASVALTDGLGRAEAASRIAATFAHVVRNVDRPDALLVAGGETLRGICEALGATALEVRGQFEPGIPHSVMRGGRWDGVAVVSKSGAFGGPSLWRDLLATRGRQDVVSTKQDGRLAEMV